MELHIDIETFSSVDIRTAGAYKYTESPDFEILLIAYAFDDGPIRMIDLTKDKGAEAYGNANFFAALKDPNIEKHAHNAAFERLAFKARYIDIPIEQWRCSAIHAAYCGLPLSLDDVSKALNLEEKGKSATGKALIKYFSCPVKATKTNGGRVRNMPHHHPEKWEEYKDYCIQDVEAEREIGHRLAAYPVPPEEWTNYKLDQEINDRGIETDLTLAQSAYDVDAIYAERVKNELKELTGLENPNSVAQLKSWLGNALKKEIESLTKGTIPELLAVADEKTRQVLHLRQQASKTSIKKYLAMLNSTCDDGRARGLFQFYGAGRTGRWAGRIIQLQNLPQNHLEDLDNARSVVRTGDYELVNLIYDNVPSVLSQLIRTALVAKEGHTFTVADFSAIEARVIAWLAREQWRLDVFNTHGKIYEASASMMFGVPREAVTRGSDYRAKGKVAELALGYQGSVGALKLMGGEKMGLSEPEMKVIVDKWRAANPAIAKLWRTIDKASKEAVRLQCRVGIQRNIYFNCDGKVLSVQLPSGRKLYYQEPTFTINKFDQESIKYKGVNQDTKQWGWVDTYGGKLTENITQAIARDLLVEAMQRLKDGGFHLVMHVHDEAICEIPNVSPQAERSLNNMCCIMGENVSWAPGLPLKADGYLTPYYKKD